MTKDGAKTPTWKGKHITIAPRLISSADCREDLDFMPRAAWPELLPGIAVNGLAWAGFGRAYFLNHIVDFSTMPSLFRELHPDLSFIELARLARVSKSIEQFPFESIFEEHFGPLTDELWNSIQLVAFLPDALANWAMERKLHPSDFAALETLLSEAPEIFEEANSLFEDLERLEVSRTEGVKILYLLSDLLINGSSINSVRTTTNESAHAWQARLHGLRHPLPPRYEIPTASDFDIDGQIKALLQKKEELLRSMPFDS